jgi:hypothetical protein
MILDIDPLPTTNRCKKILKDSKQILVFCLPCDEGEFVSVKELVPPSLSLPLSESSSHGSSSLLSDNS